MTEAHLLSPYRPPTSYPVTLNPDEASAWLVGYLALWHPAVLVRLARPPAVSSSYDHDSPIEGAIYLVPEGPALYQPDDWSSRVHDAQAVSVTTTPDQAETLAALTQALRKQSPSSPHLDAASETVRLFAALGYGYLVVESLFEAMDHEHLLDAEGFWANVQAALAPDADVRHHLKQAAEKLRSAREALNSNPIHWLDWAIVNSEKLNTPWPQTLEAGLPLTVLASGEQLEQLARDFPERFAELRRQFHPDLPSRVDLACGSWIERDDSLLPAESQLWNLTRARQVVQTLFGITPEIYGRVRSANHPQIPGWLNHLGFRKAVLVSFDGSMTPVRNVSVVTWPSPDGKTVEAFGREPSLASDPLTFFNLVYTLHQALTNDSIPTVALSHRGDSAAVGYRELLTLTELGDVLGTWTGLARYLGEYHYGEYLGAATADDFFTDVLDDRVTNRRRPEPVTGFARHLRLRRKVDSIAALASLQRSLSPETPEEAESLVTLSQITQAVERAGADPDEDLFPQLDQLESAWARRLADRIQTRSATGQPGLLVFNPCSFTRRVALELDSFPGPIPVVDPVKAAQFEGTTAKLVVEVPSLGFAWIPRTPSGPVPKPRFKSAEGTIVRNEFFEAEVDPTTGCLRAFRDLRTRLNRLGMQLVFNPGSQCRVRSIDITSSGSALGEIVSTGDVLDEQNRVLTRFRQRLRAWASRPALELTLELEPTHLPTGYPWHAYYAARFGWRDDRAALFRGVNGANTQTGYTRPVSPEYLEVRLGGERTFLFTGGLPFLQRNGSRMIDAILLPEGERGRRFEFLLAMDREYPMQSAAGWVAPTPVVETDRGPPPGATSGWLGHIDLPSLQMLSALPTSPGDGMSRAVAVRLQETSGFSGAADLRFARPVTRASLIDGSEQTLQELILAEGGVVPLEFSAGETLRVKVEWV